MESELGNTMQNRQELVGAIKALCVSVEHRDSNW